MAPLQVVTFAYRACLCVMTLSIGRPLLKAVAALYQKLKPSQYEYVSAF